MSNPPKSIVTEYFYGLCWWALILCFSSWKLVLLHWFFFYRSTFQDSKVVERSISYFGTSFGAYFLDLYWFCLTLVVALFDKGWSCRNAVAEERPQWGIFFGLCFLWLIQHNPSPSESRLREYHLKRGISRITHWALQIWDPKASHQNIQWGKSGYLGGVDLGLWLGPMGWQMDDMPSKEDDRVGRV